MTATYELHREFTLVRHLDAPREIVFRAWADPVYLGWFYNDTAPLPAEPIEVHLRVGGAWRQEMVIDEATRYTTGGIYREISPVDRLAFSWGAVGGWPTLTTDRIWDVPFVTVILEESGEADGIPATQPADTARGATESDMTFILALPDHLTEQQVEAWNEMGIEENWGLTLDRLVAAMKAEHRPAL